MNKVDNCSSATPAIRLPQRLGRPKPTRQEPAARTVTGPMAEWIRRAKETPSVRHDLVEQIRAEIEAGTYETPERIESAVDGLLAELRDQT